MGKWGLWAIVMLTACRERPTRAQVAEAGALTIEARPDAVATAPPPVERVFKVSIANFRGDDLDECDDLVFGWVAPPDAGADWSPVEDPMAKVEKGIPKTAIRIPKLCKDQFPDRQILAACIHDPAAGGGDGYKTIDGGARTYAMAAASFYNFETISGSDAQMRLCLKEHGDWTALPKDSAKYRAAKTEHDVNALRKHVGIAQKALGAP